MSHVAAPLPGVPGVHVVDVVAPTTAELVAGLQAVHARHFPGYPHVLDEIRHDALHSGDDPQVVVHQLLLLRDGRPSGEFLVHTNLRRGVVLRHHLAMDRDARADLPKDWLTRLVAHAVTLARRDAEAAGRPLAAMVSEVQPQHLAGWERLGYRALDVGYGEPRHGRGWAAHGPADLMPITPVVLLLPDGAGRPFGEVARDCLAAFLVDHYRLPPEAPEVAAILRRAAAAG